ncbi:MAG: phosphatase PAP2 family protein [Myxococcota bacterium]
MTTVTRPAAPHTLAPSEPAWSHSRALALSLAVSVAAMAPFFLLGLATDPAIARRLDTPLDHAIPFLPWTVWIYSLVYTSVFLPVFVVRCPRLFRRVIAAYVLTMAGSLVVYWLFPVTAVGFRPAADSVATDTFLGWATWLTFTLDPPVNLFPSMHLAAAIIAALAAFTARPAYGAFAAVYAAAIAVTICTMKQHYVADGLAAVALALLVWRVAIAGYGESAPAASDRAAPWPALVAYVLFQAAFYGVFYAYWRLAVAPAA